MTTIRESEGEYLGRNNSFNKVTPSHAVPDCIKIILKQVTISGTTDDTSYVKR
jgi:hypothetical protein